MEESDLLQYVEDRNRYAAWLKLPFGAQPSLFDEPAPKAAQADESPDEDDTETGAPEPVVATARRRGARGPKLVDAPNVTGSPLN
jgi:hypothetical protein